MRATSCSHSSTGARATGWRSVAQCSSVRLRRSATVWRSTSGTPTSVGRLPRCRARRPSPSAFRTRRSTVGCPRRVARPHLPRRSRRRRRLTGVRLAGVEPYRYGMSPGRRPCIRVVHRRTCGDERTVGNGGYGARRRARARGSTSTRTGTGRRSPDGPARTGFDPRVELRDRQLPGSASYTRNGECGLWMGEHAFAVEPAAPFFGSEARIRRAGRQGRRPTGRGRHRRQRPAGGTSAGGGWFVSDAFRLAGLRRSVPHLCGGGDGWPRVECAVLST